MSDPRMLADAGFVAAWFEDVQEGDTIMVEYPAGVETLTEMIVQGLRTDAGFGNTSRRFIGQCGDGTKIHCRIGNTWPCWILSGG